MTFPLNLFPIPGVSAQNLSVTSSVSGAFSVFPTATYIEVSVNAQPVYVTFDGSAPSSSNGLYLPSSYEPLVWTIDRAKAAIFKGSTGSTSNVYGVPLAHYQAEQPYVRSLSAMMMVSSYPVAQV